MINSYFKIAWRNLIKDRQFSILNLAGLSTGLACALLIFMWVYDERQVDHFNRNDDHRFQVLKNVRLEKGIETTDRMPGLLASSLAAEIPEIDYATSVVPPSLFDRQGILSAGDKRIISIPQFAGKDFFSVFPYTLIEGNAKNVLAEKNAVVLSKKLAEKLFNSSTGIVGKTVEWNQKDYSGLYIVSGIFDDVPSKGTARFDLVFSYDLFLQKNQKLENWSNGDPNVYVVLKKDAKVATFNQKISGFLKTKLAGSNTELVTQKYADRYLYSHFENGIPTGGRIDYVNLFSIIAVLILIIAAINFMNLSTAKAARRMKETGIKKVMGARRGSLICQYISEAMLMSMGSLVIALVLVSLLLPVFNSVTGKQLSITGNPGFILIALTVTILTGLLAGSYPAFYLSAFKPVQALKGKITGTGSHASLRKGFIVFQFIISAFFVVSVLVVYKQMNLIQTKNLGYDRENIIWFDRGAAFSDNTNDYAPGGKYETDLQDFLQNIKLIPGVINACNFRHNITSRDGGTSDISWQGKNPDLKVDFTDLATGYNFIETAGIQLKEGRSYSPSYGAEKSKVIFNEAAVELMGMKNPVGKSVHLWGSEREIIGVVKNFNFQSLHENLKPCFLDLTINQWASKVMVKLAAGNQNETIQRIERFYKKYNNGLAFDYRFLDEDYQALYGSEMKVAALSKYFAFIAIIISCMGLFGLSAFTAQKRQKEISIRKVVGASTGQLVLLLSKDFIQLIAVALLIAFPVSYWIINKWLNSFAYRVQAGASPFIIAGSAVLLLTLMTVSFQSLKASISNPSATLRED
jgi:ABC-type antimicrobial peptide transport system permease subunit